MSPQELKELVDVGKDVVNALNSPWMLIMAGVGSIGSVASAFYTMKAADNSRKVAELVSENQQMPSVEINSLASLGMIGSDLVSMTINIKNVGMGVARNVNLTFSGEKLIDTIDFLFQDKMIERSVPDGNICMGPETSKALLSPGPFLRAELTYENGLGKKFCKNVAFKRYSNGTESFYKLI